MSYSFSVRGANVGQVSAEVEKQIDAVVLAQPVHAADREQIVLTAKAVAALLGEDAERDILVNCNGSIWSTEKGLQSVSINVGAQWIARDT